MTNTQMTNTQLNILKKYIDKRIDQAIAGHLYMHHDRDSGVGSSGYVSALQRANRELEKAEKELALYIEK